MSRIPKEPKKIRARISLYERNLKKRDYRDGSGSRFLLGPFYMMLGDVDGALAHYKWFDKKFPDSSNEPFHVLFRCLAHSKAGNLEKAEGSARRAYLANPFLIPRILGVPHGQPREIQRGCDWEDEVFVAMAPEEFFTPWTEEDKAWLLSAWQSENFKDLVRRHIEIERQLTDERPGPRRTALVNELYALK